MILPDQRIQDIPRTSEPSELPLATSQGLGRKQAAVLTATPGGTAYALATRRSNSTIDCIVITGITEEGQGPAQFLTILSVMSGISHLAFISPEPSYSISCRCTPYHSFEAIPSLRSTALAVVLKPKTLRQTANQTYSSSQVFFIILGRTVHYLHTTSTSLVRMAVSIRS
ncbi:hypothetical protein V2G26_006096 [Clonostachys chloroleuca]